MIHVILAVVLMYTAEFFGTNIAAKLINSLGSYGNTGNRRGVNRATLSCIARLNNIPNRLMSI